jgi:hypothetical protein
VFSTLKSTNFCLQVQIDIAPDAHTFFWFFESRSDPANDPITLWLNGMVDILNGYPIALADILKADLAATA